MSRYRINSRRDIEDLIELYGFLPMFRNSSAGFSVEEMVNPALWFNSETDGPWEWKGPIVRNRRCVYGKFFSGKAGYVSLRWFPLLAKVRRSGMPLSAVPDGELDLSQSSLLEIIELMESVRSDDLKQALGLGRARRRMATDLVDLAPLPPQAARRAVARVDKLLAELQMQTRVIISDFEYPISRSGAPYGWGLARYTTPEALLGSEAIDCPLAADEAREALRAHAATLPFPRVSSLLKL